MLALKSYPTQPKQIFLRPMKASNTIITSIAIPIFLIMMMMSIMIEGGAEQLTLGTDSIAF